MDNENNPEKTPIVVDRATLGDRNVYDYAINKIAEFFNKHNSGIIRTLYPSDLNTLYRDYIYDLYEMIQSSDYDSLEESLKDNIFWICNDCESYHKQNENSYSTYNGTVCEACFDNYIECHNCHSHYHCNSSSWLRGRDGMCINCSPMIETPEQIALRKYPIETRRHKLTRIGDKNHGDTLKTSRIWSCEIEHYITDQEKAHKAFKAMPKAFGLTGDGSLTSKGNTLLNGKKLIAGYEVQTCLMQGKKSEVKIREVLKSFRDAGSVVDKTCGLHIHLDIGDAVQDVETMKRLIAFHIAFEPIIYLFVPQGRRVNKYAKTLAGKYDTAGLLYTRSVQDLAIFWYKTNDVSELQNAVGSHYQESRYYGFNMHPMFQGKNNIEIRHHSGTLSAQKILEWVNLHSRIIDYCKNNHAGLGEFQVYMELPRTLLIEKMFDLLKLEPESKKYFLERIQKFGMETVVLEEDGLEVPEKEIIDIEEEPEEVNDFDNDFDSLYPITLQRLSSGPGRISYIGGRYGFQTIDPNAMSALQNNMPVTEPASDDSDEGSDWID